MIRSISKDIVAADGAETLEDFFTTPEGEYRKVKDIWVEQAAGAFVRGYVEQDRMVDVGLECDQVLRLGIPVNGQVAVGEKFSAGFYNVSGGALTLNLVVFVADSPED